MITDEQLDEIAKSLIVTVAMNTMLGYDSQLRQAMRMEQMPADKERAEIKALLRRLIEMANGQEESKEQQS